MFKMTNKLYTALGIFVVLLVLKFFRKRRGGIGQPAYARLRSAGAKAEDEAPQVIVIGGGPAGIAAAGALKAEGIPALVLESTEHIAVSWKGHYKRLHLHTHRDVSGMPHVPIPDHWPDYISRQQVVDYINGYAQMMGLKISFNTRVNSVARLADGQWQVTAEIKVAGKTESKEWVVRNVVVATGENSVPMEPEIPGRSEFQGTVLHSSKYHSGEEFRGKKALVVGFGNSGGEISIDLWEHGVKTSVLIRSALNIAPRALVGLISRMSRYGYDKIPGHMSDQSTAMLMKMLYSDLKKFDVQCPIPNQGASYVLRTLHHAPVIDIGQIDLIRKKELTVKTKNIERFTKTGVKFVNGEEVDYDVVVLATGFRHNVANFLEASVNAKAMNAQNFPKVCGRPFADLPGLYFVGFYDEFGRLLRISDDAIYVAGDIAAKAKKTASR